MSRTDDDTAERMLVISPSGMLGRAWSTLLGEHGIDFETVGRPTVDLARPESLAEIDFERFSVVINCAAWTDVDGAEARPSDADIVNGIAVGELATRCRDADCLLVHYSTDYVFDGRAERPYGLEARHDPVNAYGRSKALGERLLWTVGGRHLLVRTSWIYASWGKNFVRTMAKLAAERETLRVVDDQRGRPTNAEHLASASLKLVRAGVTGTVHVTDGGECTWFELAREVAATINPACRVEPCTTAEFPRPAPRPAYSVLDLARAEAKLGPMPPWQHNVADALANLEPL